MKLFRCSNKANKGCWVFADNEQEALEIFFRNGNVRKLENGKAKECLFSDFPMSDVERVNVKGCACLKLEEQGQIWVVSDNGVRLKG